MNLNTIIAAVLIIAGIAVFVITNKDYTDYSDFASATGGDRIKIVGVLSKDKPMVYDPEKDPNTFRFTMKDRNEEEKEVVLNKPKPQDFEMSEQIVVTGKMKEDVFYAEDILMKCPSKYKDEEIAIKAQN